MNFIIQKMDEEKRCTNEKTNKKKTTHKEFYAVYFFYYSMVMSTQYRRQRGYLLMPHLNCATLERFSLPVNWTSNHLVLCYFTEK